MSFSPTVHLCQSQVQILNSRNSWSDVSSLISVMIMKTAAALCWRLCHMLLCHTWILNRLTVYPCGSFKVTALIYISAQQMNINQNGCFTHRKARFISGAKFDSKVTKNVLLYLQPQHNFPFCQVQSAAMWQCVEDTLTNYVSACAQTCTLHSNGAIDHGLKWRNIGSGKWEFFPGWRSTGQKTVCSLQHFHILPGILPPRSLSEDLFYLSSLICPLLSC